MVSESLAQGLWGILVPPFWVKRAFREIAGRDLRLGAVAGYPYGFQMTESKLLEAELAIRDGADYIDFAFHHSSFAAGMPWTKIELAKASHLLHSQGKLFHVQLEGHWVPTAQWPAAAKLAVDTGADAISFRMEGLRADQAQQLRQLISKNIGVKISASNPTEEEIEAFLATGVEVISVSSLGGLPH